MKQLIILALTIGLSINATKAEDQKPIYVINGIEVVSWSDVQKIDSEKIESITVYKGVEASLFSEFGDTAPRLASLSRVDPSSSRYAR